MAKPDAPPPPGTTTLVPSPEHADMALAEAVTLMQPVVRWLLRHGVNYVAFADQLKAVFLDVARAELRRSGGKATHSAISVLSGVHRKDVRSLLEASDARERRKGIPLASQVFTRWVTDPQYRSADGTPAVLPRVGPAPSFDSLARAVSTDVHPRSVLDELVRLGLVTASEDQVGLASAAFVPAGQLQELTALFVANAADHVAAAVHNLTESGPKLLEQSVFADGLSAASAEVLGQAARDAWRQVFDPFVATARERLDSDNAAGVPEAVQHRMRFGVYFYAEPTAPAAPPVPGVARDVPAAAPDRPAGRPRARRPKAPRGTP